jgi:hypothetical protein
MTFNAPRRAWRLAGVIGALLLCGAIAAGAARWPEIEFELGYAYENGSFHGWTPGFSRDDRKAFLWLSRAAQANHPRAQYMLGILLSHGWGVPRDGAQAAEWFARSARNGYAPACYHLGWMRHKGDGVPRDDGLAIRLFEQAAGQGMAAAHLALGRFREHGEGVPADPVEAFKWYTLADHFAESRPDLFGNAAFAQRAQAAHVALAARMGPSRDEQGRARARKWLDNLQLNRSGEHEAAWHIL